MFSMLNNSLEAAWHQHLSELTYCSKLLLKGSKLSFSISAPQASGIKAENTGNSGEAASVKRGTRVIVPHQGLSTVLRGMYLEINDNRQ